MPSTMVLRFRDLIADTIPEHVDIIEDRDYVWWGWWNKPNEYIPRRTWANFRETIETQGELKVLLADSGSQQIYEATLVEICASETERPIATPAPDATPIYYHAREYKAWFRFTSINEIDANDIREFSYDEVEEFLEDPYAPSFQDKRVHSIEEMLHRRHRTIYFVQPYQPGHGDKLIELGPPVVTSNFGVEPILCPSRRILHLSDLHFSPTEHGFSLGDDGPDRVGGRRQPLASHIIEDFRQEYDGRFPGIVVISGDLTWTGAAEEYDLAYEFVRDLRSGFGLDPKQMVVVPGNHDIRWAPDGEGYARDRRVTAPGDEAEANYRRFYKRLFGVAPSEYLAMGRRYVLSNFVSIDIVGVNSVRLETREFAGYGYVSLAQLNTCSQEMKWEQADRQQADYRWLVLHHHLVPVTPQEEIDTYNRVYSLTLDAGQIGYRTIELGVDLALHGHMHQPFFGGLSRTARESRKESVARVMGVHGAGSCGVARRHTGAIGKNSYSVIEPSKDSIRIVIRSWGEANDSFQFDWSVTLNRHARGGLLPARVGKPEAAEE